MPSTTALEWLSLVGIICLQSINGTNFNFPAYSSQLKKLLSISQVQLNNLAFASDAGKLFGFLPGVAAKYLPLWLVLIIGSLLGLIGYGVQYLFLTNQISSLAYWQIFLLTVVAGNSICWINTVCYVVSIRNFPADQQVAVGLSTSYQGLSAKIYTEIVNVLFSYTNNTKRAKGYLLLNSILPAAVTIVAAPLVRDIDIGKAGKLECGFIFMFLITIATGIYAVVTSLGSISSRLPPLNNLIGLLVFLSAPCLVPLCEKIRKILEQNWLISRGRLRVRDVEDHGEGIVENGVKLEAGVESVLENDWVGHVLEEIGVKLMVKRVNFWLYFFMYMTGATLGFVFLNNLGQIAESRGYSNASSIVSLASSFGFFGRLMPSLLDYLFSRNRNMFSRPASVAALMAPMSGAFFLLLNKSTVSLYMSTAIIGVCSGAITSISVSTTTELFGTKNFSVNHNVVVANIPIGSFIFGYMAALFYRRQGNGNGKCMGMECYRITFIIWGSLCFIGTMLALTLYARTRKFYSRLK